MVKYIIVTDIIMVLRSLENLENLEKSGIFFLVRENLKNLEKSGNFLKINKKPVRFIKISSHRTFYPKKFLCAKIYASHCRLICYFAVKNGQGILENIDWKTWKSQGNPKS